MQSYATTTIFSFLTALSTGFEVSADDRGHPRSVLPETRGYYLMPEASGSTAVSSLENSSKNELSVRGPYHY